MKTGGGGKCMGPGEARFQGFKVSGVSGFQGREFGQGAERIRMDQDGSARTRGVSELRGRLMIVFGDGGDYVSHEVVTDLLGVGAVDEDADPAGGDVDGIDAEEFAMAHRDVK